MTCEQIVESGAYVLGILADDEHTAYERHLRTCAVCRAEVADFAGLPDLLGKLDPAQVASIGGIVADTQHERDSQYELESESPYEPRRLAPVRPLPSVPRSTEEAIPAGRRVARDAKRRHRRWRGVTAALAAAACLAFGVLVGARFVNPAPATPTGNSLVAMSPVAATVPISAQVGLSPFVGGTTVRVRCLYNGGSSEARWTLQLVVYPRNGDAPEQISSWTAAHGDDVTLSASTRLPLNDIAKIEMRKADGTSLLVYDHV
ncbi:MAG: hypothetical protein QOI74_3786 [Micromonosporaceae bacterium]|nr:hypothetical protein [Micromonosporaceae bacterium]MDT5037927.1 hypothetical protein [Micromonosporaceae bacterium]